MTDSNVTKLPPTPNLSDYNNLVAHELAALMELIDGVAFDNLKADIAKNGIRQKIVLYEGKILDGRNRHRAAKAVGLKLTAANFETFAGTYEQAEEQVISLNVQRRQMTNAQKELVIRKMIEKYPEDSNRGIARRCGMTAHSQVAKVREKMNEPSPEARKFDQYCRDFNKQYNDLPDHLLAEFAKRFHRELRELIALAS